MNRPLALALSLYALPCMAQHGIYGGPIPAKSPEEQESIRQISATFQNIQMELMAISQTMGEMEIEKKKNLAEQFKRLEASLKKYSDPTGLQAAMTGFSTAMYAVQTQIHRTSGANLKALGDELNTIDKDLASAIGPEVLEKIRNSRRTVKREGGAKGNLGAFRSALSIFYGDKEGRYPSAVDELVPKYLTRIPLLDVPNHQPSSEVREVKNVQSMDELKKKFKDSGNWLLVTDQKSKINGTILIDCTHTDAKGVNWNSY